MARHGLTKQDCAEILDDLRRECPATSDEVLVWLAETFAFEAPVDFDPNDLISLLARPGRKIIGKQTFSRDNLPEVALQTLFSRINGKPSAEESYSGGLLTCRANNKLMTRYWIAGSINEMMKQFHDLVGGSQLNFFGVFTDEQIAEEFELFILLSVCRN